MRDFLQILLDPFSEAGFGPEVSLLPQITPISLEKFHDEKIRVQSAEFGGLALVGCFNKDPLAAFGIIVKHGIKTELFLIVIAEAEEIALL
ncbi:hypothetical protein DDZ13_00100 [Coraliomargarita sinensis]|uniref:Uncharacterized protein n=1 Tax=Coraliomargarita sinensis TaxID=2174842 RepID=A0A317ZPI9_9BACT|nr:hypothetical protein DDZ13_00100 [Coraliomargarita sinensis]